jgi:hypothetical protein
MSDETKGAKRVQDHAGTVEKGLVQAVVLPLAEQVLGGAAAGWTAAKVGQAKNPPPEKKDD